MQKIKISTIEEYIALQEEQPQERLIAIWEAIMTEFPNTTTGIRYEIPAFFNNDTHFYFATYKKHIGMYPIYRHSELEEIIALYRSPKAKDALHFLHKNPLPLDDIMKIVRFRFRN